MIRRQPSVKALSDPDGVYGLARIKGNFVSNKSRLKPKNGDTTVNFKPKRITPYRLFTI